MDAKVVIVQCEKENSFTVPMVNATLLTKHTCYGCKELECEVRSTCADDETATEYQRQKLTKLPKIDVEVEWIAQ